MDPKLQRAYEALEQADAAGNKEDAQQIADYIRDLQNQAMLGSGDESMMRNPVAAGAVGAIAGPVAGKVLETAYGPKGVSTGAPTTAPGAGSPGQKWAAKTGYGAGTGATVENVVEEFKKREGPLGKGKVTSKITGGPLGGSAAMEQIAAKEADAARFAQMRAANQMAAQKASSVPGRIAQATAGKMPLLLKSAAGAGAGMQGADAYNRGAESDYLGAGIGAIGAVGSAASLIPHPITRIGGTAIGMGAGALNTYIDYLKSKSQPQPQPQPQPQGMATGGLVHLAEGGKPPKLPGKFGAATKAVKKVAESVAAKMSPGMSFGNVAPAYEQTVTNPLRNAFPGIYKRPDVIAQEAAARVAPESPALKQLFGVTRDDLYEMGKGRVGNVSGVLPGAAANPKGSRAAMDVMNPRNEQRLLDVLGEAEKYPALVKGMDPWYIMDPVYKRMEELMGPEKARAAYQRFNTLTGMASPGSDVLTEMNRGTAANYLATQGRFGDFVNYAGKPIGARGADFPEDLRAVLGHPYHKTAQAIPMQQYLDTGVVQMSSPKVPAYIQASGVPQTGFQTDLPVGVAHWSRAVGLADTRGAATRKGQSVIPGASVSNPEMSTLAPWWRDKIAGEIGIESVPAQARAWGAFSPQTGVESPIGAPKIELLSIKIMEAAKRLGVSPEEARDLVLKGEAYAGKKEGGAVQRLADGGQPQFSNEQISSYISDIQGKGGGDAEIASAMNQFGVSPEQLSGALGVSTGDIQSRYNAVNPTGQFNSVTNPSVQPTNTSPNLGGLYGQFNSVTNPSVQPTNTSPNLEGLYGQFPNLEGLYGQFPNLEGLYGQFNSVTNPGDSLINYNSSDISQYVKDNNLTLEQAIALAPYFGLTKLQVQGALGTTMASGGSTTPAWQRSKGKNPEGGLNALGRASYKRETGGELKAPQPEGGSRKKSFCARMGGMKKKLTSSKTANDPDSRINKALRKWKC